MGRKAQTRNWLALAVMVTSLGVRLAADTWNELRSLNFTIVTNADEATGRLALYELEQLRSVLPPPENAPSLEIILLRDAADILRYAPGAHSDGFLRQGDIESRALVVAAGRRALLHEYVHYANLKKNEPLWISEGIAEYYSQFRLENGRFTVGLPDATGLAILRASSLTPVAELGAVRRETRPSNFYPQSWALVHLLMASREDLSAAGERLDERLATHIARGAPGGERQYRIVEFDVAKFRARTLGDSEASLRLIGLLPEGERTAALMEVASTDPESKEAWEMLGLQHLAGGRFDAALTAYEKAIDLGSDRAESWYLAGLIRRHYKFDGVGGERLLYRASALDPGNREYFAAWQFAKESREEAEWRAEQKRLRERAMSVAASPRPVAAITDAKVALAPARPRQKKAAAPTQTWIFAGAKLIGCTGPPEKRVCTYSR